MNVHISQEIAARWPQYEFLGHKFEINGKTYIRALHKELKLTHFYCFQDDIAWWERPINEN